MLQKREKPVVLIVDDTTDNIALLNELLKKDYRVKAAINGEKGLEVARNTCPDIILMDVNMPVMNGYEACRRLKQDEALKDIPVLFLTARSDEADEEEGFRLGAADYIVKPVTPSTLLARIQTHLSLKQARDILADQNHFLDQEVQRRTRDISIIQEATIIAMATLAETRDNETGGHLQRAKLYIRELAEELSKCEKYKNVLTPEKIKLIVLSAPLHDIGKVGIPDQILLKPGKLSAEEYEVMKKHAALGRDAIMNAENLMGGAETFLSCAREIAYSHHEKWDGSGYPQGLSGEAIPLPARLMAVVDAYDTLTSRRIYKAAVSHDTAVSTIAKDSGRHFDPSVVAAFLAVKDRFNSIATQYMDCTVGLLAQMQESLQEIRRVP